MIFLIRYINFFYASENNDKIEDFILNDNPPL